VPSFVAGDGALVGSAIVRALHERGEREVHGMGALESAALGPTDEPRAYDPHAVADVFRSLKVDRIFLTSGKAHGISENIRFPARVMLENVFLECALLHAAALAKVERLLYVASSCCYPRDCPQPMQPSSIFSGPPEPTNHAYSMAKLAALSLCQAYRKERGARWTTCIPATPFGRRDDFHPERSHVIGALLHRMHTARLEGRSTVIVWGSGAARRDFIFADDLAESCLWLLDRYDDSTPVNVSAYGDRSIRDIAEAIRRVVGFDGTLQFDASKPDGMPVKVLDGTFLEDLGWKPRYLLDEALRLTYAWYLDHVAPQSSRGQPA
jgi:GDP-L-fucose synthase